MLHLGGSKFRLKRLEWTDAEKDQEEEKEEEEEKEGREPETCADDAGITAMAAAEGGSAKEGDG